MVIGKAEKEDIIYLIDFGLVKKFRQKNGNHIPMCKGKTLVGTARYASLASHDGIEQGRKDDLESLGFLLLYFLKGRLPWQNLKILNKTEKYKQIAHIKRQVSLEKMCAPYGSHASKILFYHSCFHQIFCLCEKLRFY